MPGRPNTTTFVPSVSVVGSSAALAGADDRRQRGEPVQRLQPLVELALRRGQRRLRRAVGGERRAGLAEVDVPGLRVHDQRRRLRHARRHGGEIELHRRGDRTARADVRRASARQQRQRDRRPTEGPRPAAPADSWLHLDPGDPTLGRRVRRRDVRHAVHLGQTADVLEHRLPVLQLLHARRGRIGVDEAGRRIDRRQAVAVLRRDLQQVLA